MKYVEAITSTSNCCGLPTVMTVMITCTRDSLYNLAARIMDPSSNSQLADATCDRHAVKRMHAQAQCVLPTTVNVWYYTTYYRKRLRINY